MNIIILLKRGKSNGAGRNPDKSGFRYGLPELNIWGGAKKPASRL
jgi:hypothetical protein